MVCASKLPLVGEDHYHHDNNPGDEDANEDRVRRHGCRTSLATTSWKPLSLRTGVLLGNVLITVSIVTLLASLQYKSQTAGGVLFADAEGNFSGAGSFLQLYFPTIVAVIYGLMWSWLDFDVKRSEPWYQLNSSPPPTAERSMLLQYPVDFLALVPVRAAQARHFMVVKASLAVIIIFWAITPLQSGMFTVKRISIPNHVAMLQSPGLVSMEEQNEKLSADFLSTAYSVVWYGETMPPFTTRTGAFVPFGPRDKSTVQGENQTITATTKMYSTELDCAAPNFPAAGEVMESSVRMDDGKGCSVELSLDYMKDPKRSFLAQYIGYWDDANIDTSLQLLGCTQKSSHKFLAIWQRHSEFAADYHNSSNATAVFCQPSYFVQTVEATIALENNSVIDYQPLGSKVAMADDVFNVTQFEYILGVGVPYSATSLGYPQVDPAVRNDIAAKAVIHQDSHLANWSLVLPTSNMVGFAVGATRLAPADYLDSEHLKSSFEQGHQLLFAIAVQSTFESLVSSDVRGTIHSERKAVQLVPTFTFAVLGCLGIVLILTIAMIFRIRQRHTRLPIDPGSLSAVLSIFRHSDLIEHFQGLDFASTDSLVGAVKPAFCATKLDSNGRVVVVKESSQMTVPVGETESFLGPQRGQSGSALDYKPVQPREWSQYAGSTLIVCLTGILAVIIYLRKAIQNGNGLPLPSDSVVVQQLLFNAIPTIIATLMEPLWVLLARWICILYPYIDLWRGNVPASRSLSLDYAAYPPQLVTFKALRNGHLLLAIICFITILANILTVSLSGLFNVDEVSVQAETNLTITRIPAWYSTDTLNEGYTQNDGLYVARSNFSNGTPLPIGATEYQYFLPLQIPERQHQATTNYVVNMTGYGARLDCQNLEIGSDEDSLGLDFNDEATAVQLSFTHRDEDGYKLKCVPNKIIYPDGSLPLVGNPEGRKAMEICLQMQPDSANDTKSRETCWDTLIIGWIRADTRLSPANTTSNNGGSGLLSTMSSSASLRPVTSFNESHTFMGCKPLATAAMFEVVMNPSNHILRATRITPEISDPSSADLSYPLDLTTGHLSGTGQLWHNDTFATEWRSYMIKTMTNSSAFLDASLPPPTFAEASGRVGDLYSRLFPINAALKASQLYPAPNSTDGSPNANILQGIAVRSERRVFMSTPMYYISITILSIDIIVAIVFYGFYVPKPFLPRMPTSVASQVAYFAASYIIDDMKDCDGDVQRFEKRGDRYGFGKYIGRDGRVHLGIEKWAYVRSSKGVGQQSKKRFHGLTNWKWWNKR